MYTVTVEDRELSAMIARLQKRLGDMTSAMDEIGGAVKLSVKRNFEEQGRPQRWKSSRRAQRSGGVTLSDTGRLRSSFTHRPESHQVTIGTNVRYAAILHFGGRTPARRIVARNGKALNIPGIGLRRAVNHPGSNIPARPFLMLQEQDVATIGKIVDRYLTNGL